MGLVRGTPSVYLLVETGKAADKRTSQDGRRASMEAPHRELLVLDSGMQGCRGSIFGVFAIAKSCPSVHQHDGGGFGLKGSKGVVSRVHVASLAAARSLCGTRQIPV